MKRGHSRGGGSVGRGSNRQWWSYESQKKRLGGKGSDDTMGITVKDSETITQQFWRLNETILKKLGIEGPQSIHGSWVRDDAGGTYTFTLPISGIKTEERQCLATSYKKAFHKHERVLVLIECDPTLQNRSQTPPPSSQGGKQQHDASQLRMLASLGIGNVNVVYRDGQQQGPGQQQPQVDQTDPVQLRQFLSPAILTNIDRLIQHGELRPQSSKLTLECVESLLALTEDDAINMLMTEISAKRLKDCNKMSELIADCCKKHQKYTKPSDRRVKIALEKDFPRIQVAILIEVSKHCGPILRWCQTSPNIAFFEFCTVDAANKAMTVKTLFDSQVTSVCHVETLPAECQILIHKARETVNKANNTQPGTRPGLTPITGQGLNMQQNQVTLLRKKMQSVTNQLATTAAAAPPPPLIPPMPVLESMSQQTTPVHSACDGPADLPPLFEMESDKQVNPGTGLENQPPSRLSVPPQGELIQKLMEKARTGYPHQGGHHPTTQHHPPSSMSPRSHASVGMPPQAPGLPQSQLMPQMMSNMQTNHLPMSNVMPPHQVPHPAPPPQPTMSAVDEPLTIVDQAGCVNTFFLATQPSGERNLVWSGKECHNVVRKIVLRFGLWGPEYTIGQNSTLLLKWDGLNDATRRLKTICEKAGNVQCDVDCVTGNTQTDAELEANWNKTRKTKDCGTSIRVSYDPYAKSPQKELPPPVSRTTPSPMGGAARSIVPSTDSNKKLNAYATPFVPGAQVPPPTMSQNSYSTSPMMHQPNPIILSSPPPVPEMSHLSAPQNDPHVPGSLTKFDEPSPFVYQGATEAKIFVSPSLDAHVLKTMSPGATVDVYEILSSGPLAWAKIGQAQWTLMGDEECNCYLRQA